MADESTEFISTKPPLTKRGYSMEQISEELRAEIRKIVHEELARIYWSDLKATYPELVQKLQSKIPDLVPDLPE